jgi:hypothetical protein
MSCFDDTRGDRVWPAAVFDGNARIHERDPLIL